MDPEKYINNQNKIFEQHLKRKIREQFFQKFVNHIFVKICYYPRFYSSLRDKMGPNGDIFKTMYNFTKTGMKSIK